MRVIIAEDEGLLRDGLTRLLTDEGYDVVATAANATEVVAATRALRPDLVITDIRMPPTQARDGIEAALSSGRRCRTWPYWCCPSMSTARARPNCWPTGRAASATCSSSGSWTSTRSWTAPGGAGRRHGGRPLRGREMMGRPRPDNPVDRLRPRRRETLALMAEGISNSRIAEELVVTEHAVARNISAIFDTLGLPPSTSEHRRVLAVLRYLDRPGP